MSDTAKDVVIALCLIWLALPFVIFVVVALRRALND